MKTALLIPSLSLIELEEEFNYILNCEYLRVNGVYSIDSGVPGPVLGITMNTHGNEPSGLATSRYLRQNFNSLKKGKIIFVLNNLKATNLYFEAQHVTDPVLRDILKDKSREFELNMNRLPSDSISNADYHQYEILRAKELLPIWEKFDVALDIHSATQDSPMIVACGDIHWNLIKGFPISNIISNITNVQINKPAIHFYGNKSDVVRLGIESGSHENSSSFERSIQSCLALLVNLGMIEDKYFLLSPDQYKHYKVVNSVMFEDSSYMLTEIFKTFALIEKGRVIGVSETKPNIISPINGHTLFAKSQLKPTSILEEILFISEPVIIETTPQP